MDMFPTSTTTLHFQVDMDPPEARWASAEMFEDQGFQKGPLCPCHSRQDVFGG